MVSPTEDERRRLGQGIRYWRQKLGLSQRDLARKLGWSRSRLQDAEHGRYEVTITMIYALAFTFDVDLVALLAGPSQQSICASCGTDFPPQKPWQRFCSPTCRTRAFRRRRKADQNARVTH